MPSFATAAAEFLSVTEQVDLIATAQDTPAIIATQDDGTEVTRYIATPSSEAAFERLFLAFLPAIEKAGRVSKVLDSDEALAVSIAEFTEAVRDFDVTSTLPFSATISTRLRFAVLRADLANDVIRVKRSSSKVYFNLVHKHGGDFAAAYADAKATPGMDPSTFLAIHHVIGGIDSIDPVLRAEDSDNGARHSLASAVGSHEEQIATEAEVAWLFTLVTDEEATVLRLAYGFCDDATENLRVAAGFSTGEILSDVEISGTAIGLGRATVNRRRLSGLSKMREALIAKALDDLA